MAAPEAMVNIQKQPVSEVHLEEIEIERAVTQVHWKIWLWTFFLHNFVHQLLIFFRVSDIWDICLISARLSADLESFVFGMGSYLWVNDNHRPIANAGRSFANMGQILALL